LAPSKVTIRVLGPFELTADDRPVSLTAGRLRSLLVVLAMSAGKPVSFDLLASAVWGEELPGNARRSLQNYAGRLRAAVGAARVDSSAAGFALLVDEDDVDALRFVRLLDEAAHLPGVGAERSQLVEALGLWRGEPYEGVRSEWLHQNHAPRLVERYLSALERRIDLDLTHGRNGDLAAELGELTTRYPLRESLWVRMLAALSQSGRHAEALEAYETIRGRIADELGVDPGPELRQAHADLLAGRAPVAQHDGGRPPPAVVPRQLPAVIDRLAGRGDAMKELDGLLTDDRRTPSVCVITGTAGVGKTTLAVRWARRMAGRFPDGQLYVDLGGFGPSEEVAEPADVLRDFLGALSVSPARVPSSTAALTGLFRSLLTGKRVLVLLDNARDADQVRPLLPSSLDCLTLITSRNDMAGLVVTEAAHPISLDVLSPAEAWQLLATRLGQDRASQDPRAVESIIRACARLPLALAIVAARATLHPSLSLAALATGLRDAHDDLDALDTGDAVTNVRAVFSWSYRAITPEAARLFRLLGLHPGPEISVAAAASLAARPMPQAKALLVQLQQANLVNWSAADRYRPHDLLWAYARELVEREHTESERHGAVRRLVEHYLHTACAADRLLDPVRDPITPHSRTEDVATESLPDKESAHAWMTTERHVLLAVCKQAADQGLDIHVWQLAWAVTTFLDRQGLWHDWAWTQQLALRAAERLDDGSETARAHRALGRAETRLYRYSDAHTHFTQAVRLYTELADPVGQAITHINIGWMFECQEEFGQALRHNERALELFEQCDHKVGQAKVLNALGWDYAKLGDYSTALPFCERSLKLNLELDDGFGQAETWDSLGYIHLNRGDHRQAIVCYEHALELHYELGATALAASILRDIGDAYSVAGDMPTARTYHLRALAIMEELHDPDADQVRARLRGYAEQRDS
jgi:DNA-binding SARP family transcriptional activator/tetratricopeptide (TPR) repeat protein